MFCNANVIESQECYFLGDININLQPKDEEIFGNKSTNTINKEIPHLTRSNFSPYQSYTYELIWQSQSISHQIDLCCTRKTSIPKFHKHTESAIQLQDKLRKKFRHSSLETDKGKFKVAEMHLQKMILQKKKSYFEEGLDKNRNKPNFLVHLV